MQNSNSKKVPIQVTGNSILYQLQNLRQLVFEVTEKCNLSCSYCTYSDIYNKYYDLRNGKDIPFAKAKLMIDYLYNLWKDNYSEGVDSEIIISFYGGEPLMNITFIKQVIDYLNSLDRIGRKYSFGMTTNAMLLDQYMDFLVDQNFRLSISLDGDEHAQSYRVDHSGKNSFNRVFHNVKLLQSTYPEYFSEKVSFLSVLHSRNNVATICQFITTNFNKIPKIMPLNNAGVNQEKKEEYNKMYRNPVQSLYDSIDCEAWESKLLLQAPRVSQLSYYMRCQSGNMFDTYNDLFINKDHLNISSTGTCVPFYKKLYLTVSGKILPCERIDHCFSFGQVHDDHVELDVEYVAMRYNFFNSKFAKQCINCAGKQFCLQCVYQVDDILEGKPDCPNFITKKELKESNKKTFSFLEKHPQYYKRILEEVKILR